MKDTRKAAQELKDIFELLSSRSDAVRGGYSQNKKVIEQALNGEKIEYHLNIINLGFFRAMADCPDLSEIQYKSVIQAVSNFDEALKE